MMDYYYYGPHMYGIGPWGGIVGLFFGLLIIALVIRIIFFIARGGRWHRWERWHHMHGDQYYGAHPSNTALDILNERYAKGEINKEEYEAKKADITKS